MNIVSYPSIRCKLIRLCRYINYVFPCRNNITCQMNERRRRERTGQEEERKKNIRPFLLPLQYTLSMVFMQSVLFYCGHPIGRQPSTNHKQLPLFCHSYTYFSLFLTASTIIVPRSIFFHACLPFFTYIDTSPYPRLSLTLTTYIHIYPYFFIFLHIILPPFSFIQLQTQKGALSKSVRFAHFGVTNE